MPVVCIGTDIVSIKRIEQAQSRWGLRLAEKILSQNEIHDYILACQSPHFLAKRFAAKEACLKALGTGAAYGVRFVDIEITHTAAGQPLLQLSAKAYQRADELGAHNWLLSISDEQDYAIAYVLATV